MGGCVELAATLSTGAAAAHTDDHDSMDGKMVIFGIGKIISMCTHTLLVKDVARLFFPT